MRYGRDAQQNEPTTQKRGPKANPSNNDPGFNEVGPPRCANETDHFDGSNAATCSSGYPSNNQKFVDDPTFSSDTGAKHFAEISGPLCPQGFWRPHNKNECFNWPRFQNATLHVVSLPVAGPEFKVVVAGTNRCPESKSICGHGANLGGETNYSKTTIPYIESTLTVSSVPSGYSFSSWSGCDSVTSNGAGCNVLIDSGEVQRVVVNLVQN